MIQCALITIHHTTTVHKQAKHLNYITCTAYIKLLHKQATHYQPIQYMQQFEKKFLEN